MTVKSSLNLSPIRPANAKNCRACGLYLNQYPVFGQAHKPEVFWVGLSAVRFDEGEDRMPLSPDTRSGALIELIEEPLRKKVTFYKTNLVKCLPLKEGKIRYPLRKEMEKCCPNFEDELATLQPSIVFLLGKQVASFVLKKFSNKQANLPKDFKYDQIIINDTTFVPIHHPSYILVYNRRNIDNYVKSLRRLCEAACYNTY